MKTEEILNTIKSFEETLLRYRLEEHPESIFYSGLIKNTEEFIEELKDKIEKNKNNK